MNIGQEVLKCKITSIWVKTVVSTIEIKADINWIKTSLAIYKIKIDPILIVEIPQVVAQECKTKEIWTRDSTSNTMLRNDLSIWQIHKSRYNILVYINIYFKCYSKYAKEHIKSDSFSAFAAKVLMTQGASDQLNTLEDCRWKLESVFEENFKPEQDFFHRLKMKRDRKLFCSSPAEEYKVEEEKKEVSGERSSLIDD